MAPLTSPEISPISSSNVLNKTCPKAPSMFHFLFMNIAHLINKTKLKLRFLADLCDASTLFLCFCETFLHDGIGDGEIHRPSSKSERNLIILQVNINGLRNKLEELKLLIHDTHADIITIQEIKLTPKAKTPKIHNFTSVRTR